MESSVSDGGNPYSSSVFTETKHGLLDTHTLGQGGPQDAAGNVSVVDQRGKDLVLFLKCFEGGKRTVGRLDPKSKKSQASGICVEKSWKMQCPLLLSLFLFVFSTFFFTRSIGKCVDYAEHFSPGDSKRRETRASFRGSCRLRVQQYHNIMLNFPLRVRHLIRLFLPTCFNVSPFFPSPFSTHSRLYAVYLSP